MDCDGGSVSNTETIIPVVPQSGSTLLFSVGALVVLSGLAAGLILTSPHAVLTTQAGANEMRAYYLALSGLNFWADGRSGTFSIGDDAITLTQSGPDAVGAVTVTSIGTVDPGSPRETNVRVAMRRQTAATITFANDIDAFKAPTLGETTNVAEAILVFGTDASKASNSLSYAEWVSLWAQYASRYVDGWVRLGGGTSDSSAAVWYTGSKAACDAGKCAFGSGLRVSFGFTFDDYDNSSDSKERGDGFTFAIVTAENDPEAAAGGPTFGRMGEYLGYAGPGISGQGIKAPKMAIEVDTYPNRGGGNPASSNSRRDKSNANHVAIVYWGGTETNCDDNTHGAGDSPRNPDKTSSGYQERVVPRGGANWLEDAEEHAMRVEIHRATESGEGVYTVLAWIDPTGTGKSDVTADYTAEPALVSSTVRLAAADHARLDAIRFGWTEATGAETQTVAIHDFALAFRH
ncbi:conserved hypothetical protein [Solidesulfovibrio fructosivorans JJ]]|uniref:Uncharacterized protein n=1 Tax=Solidesulfovibrio fructosivorans JJ] TaxID=596151 RepID=E1K0F1_SOLFR|nr:hypothetical protein [Solidesulfovibrio fructosivorans]EFL49894.1 conserved hypothetical protein [Solidesulfovibrio fructosivorans JJ]]